MEIAIIGAGKMGANLARLFVGAGHTVRLANSRGPESLAALVAELGDSAVALPTADVAKDADLVVVTIPQRYVPDLPAQLLATRKPGAPVIDTGNYYPWARDGRIADGLIQEIEDGLPDSAWVARQLGAPVVKAFNGILWSTLLNAAAPAGSPGRIALPIAGDDAEAKQVVMELVDEIGFDPVDAGPLAESWRQHPGTPVYGADTDVEGVRRALAAARPGRPLEWRAAGDPAGQPGLGSKPS